MKKIKLFFNIYAPISGINYLAWGCGLFLIKYFFDYQVAVKIFKTEWPVWSYFRWFTTDSPFESLDIQFVLALLAVAFPFIIIGLVLTLRRLKTLNLPAYLSILFFIPGVNISFFTLLIFLKANGSTEVRNPTFDLMDKWMPQDLRFARLTSIFGGILIILTYVLGTFIYLLVIVKNSKDGGILSGDEVTFYGILTFIGIPFLSGFVTVILLSFRFKKLFFKQVFLYANIPILIALASLSFLQIEGILCLATASPLIFGMSTLGGTLAWCITSGKYNIESKTSTLKIFLVFPVLLLLDLQLPDLSREYAVVTKVSISAPPEIVWENVGQFPKIEKEWKGVLSQFLPTLEESVIDIPLEDIKPGTIRRCIFNRGEFIEPIKVWNPPYELTFDVKKGIKHYNKYGQVVRGQFLLYRQSNNTTLLVGTSWYRYKVRPAVYWNLFGSYFLHKIHYRALNHIKQLSETKYVDQRLKQTKTSFHPNMFQEDYL